MNKRILTFDLRPLAGIVDSGSTFGLLLTFEADTATSSDKEVKWGRDNITGKQFRQFLILSYFLLLQNHCHYLINLVQQLAPH